jgi:hypothetical protein
MYLLRDSVEITIASLNRRCSRESSIATIEAVQNEDRTGVTIGASKLTFAVQIASSVKIRPLPGAWLVGTTKV